ncbi:MAG: protease HtpX [Actinobacteria bacterium QS_5_72_10]|nr:MAG: protease HtpX [Actinobacteria bacterium QS_5_72_10]
MACATPPARAHTGSAHSMFSSMKTWVLLALLSGLLLFVGQVFGGNTGLIIALGIALVMNIGSYWFSDRIAIKMARAQPADEATYGWYHRLIENLSQVAGQPKPRLYVSPSPQPNAFATGRNPENAAVCVNQGLIDLLTVDEMEGVLAHELSHVHNRDILIGSVAATIATAVVFLSRLGFLFGGRDNFIAQADGVGQRPAEARGRGQEARPARCGRHAGRELERVRLAVHCRAVRGQGPAEQALPQPSQHRAAGGQPPADRPRHGPGRLAAPRRGG